MIWGGGLGQKRGKKNSMATRLGKKNSTATRPGKKTHQQVGQEKKPNTNYLPEAPPRSLIRIFCKPIDSMLWQSIESMGLQKITNGPSLNGEIS